MFSSKERIEEKSAASGKGRLEYLQSLVTEFQDTDDCGLFFKFIVINSGVTWN